MNQTQLNADPIRVASAPVPGRALSVNAKLRYSLSYPDLKLFDINVKLNPIAKGKEFYKKPPIVARDAAGNKVRKVSVMKDEPHLIIYPKGFPLASGVPTKSGATAKKWVRLKDIESLDQLKTMPWMDFEVAAGEVQQFKTRGFGLPRKECESLTVAKLKAMCKGRGIGKYSGLKAATLVDKCCVNEVPYTKPQQTKEIAITGYNSNQFANEYIYSDKVFQLIEMDPDGKRPNDQARLAQVAKGLRELCTFSGNLACPQKKVKRLKGLEHVGACNADQMQNTARATAQSGASCTFTPTKERTDPRGSVGIIKNFIQTTGSHPSWGIISSMVADDGFSLVMRLATRPFTPQRVAFPSPVEVVTTKVEALGALE